MPAAQKHRSPLTRLHDRVALGLAVIVPFTAVPLASNRASLWLLWTALLCLLTIGVLLRSWQLEPAWRPRILSAQRLPLVLALVVPVWAGVQLLPIGAILPLSSGPALSALPDAGLSGILRFVGYILMAALVLEIASRRERVLRVGAVIFAGIVVQAVWALVALHALDDFSPWGEKTAYLGSATGTFINRNSLATFLGLGLVLGVGLLVERGLRDRIRETRGAAAWQRLGYDGLFILLGMVFLLIALVATQSRLGVAASLAALTATVMVVRFRSGTAPARLAAEGAALVLMFGTVALLLGAGGVSERLLFSGADDDNRIALYRQTLGMIATRPFTGYGMDAFGAAFEGFRAPPLDDPVSYDLAHNSYFALWSEFGVIFGSAPIIALGVIGYRLVRRLGREDAFPGMAMAALGALLLCALHSTGDFSFEIPANNYVLAALLGLGLGRRSGSNRHEEKRAEPKLRAAAPGNLFGDAA